MKSAKICVLFVLALGCAQLSNASEQQRDQGYWVKVCSTVYLRDSEFTRETYQDAQACVNYLGGIMNGFETAYAMQNRPLPYCLPDGYRMATIGRMAMQYWEAHPEDDDKSASDGLFKQFMAKFPCRK